MKLSFKLLLLAGLSLQATCREIVVLSYKTKSQSTDFMIDSMKKEVTEKLLTVIESDTPCDDKYKDAILHVCFDDKNEVKIVRQNVEVLKRSISKI